MNKSSIACLLVTIAFVFTITACKKKSEDEVTPTPTPTAPVPAVTAVGTPAGIPTTVSIDAAGGTVTSTDGILELIFPAGAVSSVTDITIQPITNMCVGGLGLAYRIGADDAVFSTAVTVKFHYATLNLGAVNNLATSIAWQQDNNTWKGYMKPVIDTVSKTVSYAVTQFGFRTAGGEGSLSTRDGTYIESDISFIERFKIHPVDATVNVGQVVTVYVYVTCDYEHIDLDQFDVLSWDSLGIAHEWIGSWAINNTPSGNATIGTLFTQANFARAVYHAPADVPSPNTVFVTAKTKDLFPIGTVTLVCPITIVEGRRYKMTVLDHLDNISFSTGGQCSVTAYEERVDFEFTVIRDSNVPDLGYVTLLGIENYEPAFSYVSGACTCTGMFFSNGSYLDYTALQAGVWMNTLEYTWTVDRVPSTESYQCPLSDPETMTAPSTFGFTWSWSIDLPESIGTSIVDLNQLDRTVTITRLE